MVLGNYFGGEFFHYLFCVGTEWYTDDLVVCVDDIGLRVFFC